MRRSWGLPISGLLLFAFAGCESSREAQERAAYEWQFRKLGLAIGTTLEVGGPSIAEIRHYQQAGVVSAEEAEAMIARWRAVPAEEPRVGDEKWAIAAVARTAYARSLAQRIALHLHAEGRYAYGRLVYLGEERDGHTVLIKRLLVKDDGSVWDSADTDWDAKSFTIPLE